MGEARLVGKVREFLSIWQGKVSVAEYVTKFYELAWFASTMVPTDEARKMKFMHGLRLEIAKQIDSGKEGPESYTNVVQRALHNNRWDKQEDKSVETRPAS